VSSHLEWGDKVRGVTEEVVITFDGEELVCPPIPWGSPRELETDVGLVMPLYEDELGMEDVFGRGLIDITDLVLRVLIPFLILTRLLLEVVGNNWVPR
jgi:hypothetical protein